MNTWPTKKLGEVIDINFGERITKTDNSGKKYPVYGGGGESFRTDAFNRENEYVISRFAIAENCVRFVGGKFWVMDSGGTFSIKNDFVDKLDKNFIGNVLLSRQKEIYNCARGGAQKNIDVDYFKKIKIPLPPLETQKQIVGRLDKIAEAQKLNDKLIQKSDELFQSLLHKELDPEGKKNWEVKNIGEVCKIIGGGTPSREEIKHFKGDIPWVTVKDLKVLEIEDTLEHINKEALKKSAANLVPVDTVLVATRVGLGKVAIARKSLTFNQDIKGLRANDGVDADYLFYVILKNASKIEKNGKGATVKGVTQEFLKSIKIPIPSLKIQKQIVEKLSAAQEYKKQLLAQKSLLKELFDSVLDSSMDSLQVNP